MYFFSVSSPRAGRDSDLASSVTNAGPSLQQAIFSRQHCCWEVAAAENTLEWSHKRYCLRWNLSTSCLSSGQLIVLTHIPCDLSSLTWALPGLWQAPYQCLTGGSEWVGKWQQSPHYWQLRECWNRAENFGLLLCPIFPLPQCFIKHAPPCCCVPWEGSVSRLKSFCFPFDPSSLSPAAYLVLTTGLTNYWMSFC